MKKLLFLTFLTTFLTSTGLYSQDFETKQEQELDQTTIKQLKKQLLDAVWNNNLDKAIKVLEKGININSELNYCDDTALIIATNKGYNEIIDYLVSQKADVNIKNNNNQTALHYAVTNENIGAVKFLLIADADVNIQGSFSKETPLIIAAKKNYSTIASILLDNGADPSIKDIYEKTALDHAIQNKHIETIQLFRETRTQIYSKPKSKSLSPKQQLFHGIKNNSISEIEEALKNGTDIDSSINDSEFPGQIPILVAARENKPEILSYLIQKGANVNKQDSFKHSALYRAICTNSSKMVEILLKAKANVNNIEGEYNHNRISLLMYAVLNYCDKITSSNNLDIISQLVKAGADIGVVNTKGQTVIDIANEENCKELAEFLQKAWETSIEKEVRQAGFEVPHTTISQIIAQYAAGNEKLPEDKKKGERFKELFGKPKELWLSQTMDYLTSPNADYRSREQTNRKYIFFD